MENNTSRTAICSSCVATLPAESAITSAKHAGKDLQHHDADVELNKKSRKATHFLAFVLWALDVWTRNAHIVMPCTRSMRNPTWESCCKQGSVQLQLLSDPPEYLKNLLASNLRQYNAAFKFTSLGYDIVSAEERNANNIRDEFNAFQIHGALCHRQGPLIPYEDSEPSYAQLYIYDPSFAAQRRSERNENLNLEIITELSTMLSHCNHFSCIYRHAHEILSRNENTNTGGGLSNNTNDNNESNNLPYIIISPSMRMRLIEGSDICTTNLPTMEEVAAVIPTEYSDRSFRDIVLTLRSYSNLRQSTG
ncbi:hypothetical protein BCV71DRAFT_240250, partial [Rhizopus microsporus]